MVAASWRRRIGFAIAPVLLAAAGVLGLLAWRSFPVLDGELRVGGLGAPVDVRRDAADVTHIEAASLADAYFAIGWVHAQERGWQLEFNRRLMRGELSEVLGPRTLATDRLLRTLGILPAAQAQWERLPARERRLLQSYADGINAFHAGGSQLPSPEFHLLRVQPGRWTPQDSMGWALMMALDLGANWGNEFARLSLLQRLSTDELWQLMPPYPGEPPATTVDLAALYRSLDVYRDRPPHQRTGIEAGPDPWLAGLGHAEGVGSNNWVVAGSRSASGRPLLANDPHLSLHVPAIWYMARLKAPAEPGGRATDVIGATLPGLPVVVLGRTAGVAWSYTNTAPDVQDLYLEQIDPERPGRYRTPGGWASFSEREELIRVKGEPDHRLRVRATRHGPVVSDVMPGYADVIDTRRYVLALRWAALDADNTTVQAGMAANEAQTVDELLQASALHHSPMQNLLAADTQGRMAFEAIGRVPLRRGDDELRGIAPAPGWDARHDWAGWLPASAHPRATHEAIAARGWWATANQRVLPPGYSHFIGGDWATPERFERIEQLLAASDRHDLRSMAAIQADTVSSASRRLLPLLQRVRSSHPLAAEAQAQLRGFDGDMRADAAAPLIVAAWADEMTRALVAPRIGAEKFQALYGKRSFRPGLELMLEQPAIGRAWCAPLSCEQHAAAALDRALVRIAADQGREVAEWRWGRAHPALSVHRPLGSVPLLARVFDVSVPSPGDAWTVNVGQYLPNHREQPFASRHAASLRTLYDLADPERSLFISQAGQSGLVFSSRYRDMAGEWARVQYRPLRLNPPHWVHQLVLRPGPAPSGR
ncbi:penicillin acylase family protein [Ramlibacter sp. AW1]|uniref:Penicillin acylase family protein n=1 Tax=Ramlibacter aurantiacus TaxID=2801330 RepID=A0A936ZNU1_9BURK|nr:penicillin acylase family protein [Ramlibacter aurantiacus]